MSFLARFAALDEGDKSQAIKKLIADSTPDFDFFYLIVLSVFMATLGLLINSEAVIIGSMLIAPILFPVISVGLGMAMSDPALITRSLYTIAKAVALGVVVAFATTILFSPNFSGITEAILSRAEPSLPYAFVAIAAGLAVAYSMVRPELSVTFPGIAVSVALIPPLAVVGIGIAKFNIEIISGSFLLLLLNVVGIIFACVTSFALMDVSRKRKVAEKTIQKEAARVQEEEAAVQKIAKEHDEQAAGTSPASSSQS